jgi:uncharacterized pyridoxamine 5'-phosphate oxidase family protein
MYHQIRDNPAIAISGMTSDNIVVRIEGTLTFMEDKTFLERLIKNNEGMYAGKTDILERFSLPVEPVKFLISPPIFLEGCHLHLVRLR